VAQHEAELARLHEVMKLRYGHALCLTGTEAGFGGANSDAMMAKYEKRMTELGADPLAHYSNVEKRPVVGERAAALQAEADAAARDARAAGAFERGGKTQQVPVKPQAGETTGAVAASGGNETAGRHTLQVKPGAAREKRRLAKRLPRKARQRLAQKAAQTWRRGRGKNWSVA
jgi:hypothetical protein